MRQTLIILFKCSHNLRVELKIITNVLLQLVKMYIMANAPSPVFSPRDHVEIQPAYWNIYNETENIMVIKFRYTFIGNWVHSRLVVRFLRWNTCTYISSTYTIKYITLELNTFFKNKRIVNGIPPILYWGKGDVELLSWTLAPEFTSRWSLRMMRQRGRRRGFKWTYRMTSEIKKQ